jgi:hypothetical protein
MVSGSMSRTAVVQPVLVHLLIDWRELWVDDAYTFKRDMENINPVLCVIPDEPWRWTNPPESRGHARVIAEHWEQDFIDSRWRAVRWQQVEPCIYIECPRAAGAYPVVGPPPSLFRPTSALSRQ